MNKITVIHKRNDCIGCGSCALIDPKHRTMNDEDGKSDLLGSCRKGNQMMVGKVDEDEITATKEAAKACPVDVIQVAGG